MIKQTLIIKLGALGDVIRTTPLLRVLEGEITWATSTLAMPLLKNNPLITNLTAMDEPGFNLGHNFDLVINLEDDLPAAKVASAAASGNIVGPYLNDSGVTYNAFSSEWFDMSLSSRYGRQIADGLKMRNRKTYQEMVFSALGISFSGEDPVLTLPLHKSVAPNLVGIEQRAGGVWPNKRWNRYEAVSYTHLSQKHHVTAFLDVPHRRPPRATRRPSETPDAIPVPCNSRCSLLGSCRSCCHPDGMARCGLLGHSDPSAHNECGTNGALLVGSRMDTRLAPARC